MNIRNSVAIIVLGFILSLTVGYALLNDSLTVGGTATAQGTFDMKFADATVLTQNYSTGATVTKENEDKLLRISVPDLQQPGAFAEFLVTVINNGSIPSNLTNVDLIWKTSNPSIKVSYEGLEELKNVVCNHGETQTFKIKVMWDENNDQTSQDVEFDIKLLYKQIIAQDPDAE